MVEQLVLCKSIQAGHVHVCGGNYWDGIFRDTPQEVVRYSNSGLLGEEKPLILRIVNSLSMYTIFCLNYTSIILL